MTAVALLEDRYRQRLRRLAWHTRHNARTPNEARIVELLVEAANTGRLTLHDACERLSRIRTRQQHTERHRRQAAA